MKKTFTALSLALSLAIVSQAQLLVADGVPGSFGSGPAYITLLGSNMYFMGYDTSTNGKELWKSDGTAAGTHILKDIYPGKANSTPYSLAVIGSRIYFQADDGVNGIEPWYTDGTTAGTQLLKNIASGSTGSKPFNFTEVGSYVYFNVLNGTQRVLCKSDGTSANTNIIPGYSDVYSMIALDANNLLFMAKGPSGGKELYRINNATSVVTKVKEINPSGDAFPLGIYSEIINHGGKFYFNANNGVDGFELWVSDGSDAGTFMVKDMNPAPFGHGTAQNFISVASQLFFLANTPTEGLELWVSDGTTAGTRLVKDINPGSASGPSISSKGLAYHGKLYFSANNGVDGFELWESDGTNAGTKMLKDINPTGSAYHQEAVVCNDRMYFSLDDGTHGYEFWLSDGTDTGTRMVSDFLLGADSQSPGELTVIGTDIFYSGTDVVHGRELWKLATIDTTSSDTTTTISRVFQNTKNINCYPNPCSEQCTIDLSSLPQANYQIRIYNSLGQQMLQQDVDSTQLSTISTQAWLPAQYFVYILQNGQAIQRSRFAKQ
jgi:ELWxxDGT repeat protein